MKYAVMASDKGCDNRVLLRRCDDYDSAAAHALKANMKYWEDVWVEEDRTITPIYEDPMMPLEVLWEGHFAYIVDSNKRKIASLLGTYETRAWLYDQLQKAGLIAARSNDKVT